MPKMVFTHDVADVDAWLQARAERAEAIAALGGSNVVDYAAHDGSNTVAITADVDDPDALMATLASPPPEVAEIMQSHGVIPPVKAYVVG